MSIISIIVHILFGIWVVLKGADKLTDGAVSLAKHFKMPEMVIGLTVVALGTSMPELSVSLSSAVLGVTDIAVANVIGSNIFNVLLIGGVSACVAPMLIRKSTIKRDVPVAIAASLLLLGCGLYGEITRWMGIVFICLLAAYIAFTIKTASPDEDSGVESKQVSVSKSVFYICLGLFMLVAGSAIFVDYASELAGMMGISDAIIGLTIVAGGTSLPELATSVVAAKKGQSEIAMGNVLGSCVYNILLIIGATGAISPLVIDNITPVDFGLMAFSMLLLWFFSFTKYKLERWEGAVLVGIFAAYMGWLIYTAI